MKILYVGHLTEGSTSSMRFANLIKIGHSVEGICSKSALPRNGLELLLFKIYWRCGWVMYSGELNNLILQNISNKSFDVLWVDKGVQIKSSTLKKIKYNHQNILIIHYNPDDPFGSYGKGGWRTFLNAIPYYDIHFVPRFQNIQEYKSYGAKKVIFNVPTRGFDPTIHRPYLADNRINNAFKADIGFLGAYEADRYRSLLRVANAGFSIRLIHDWPEKYWHPNFIRAPFNVVGEDYARAVQAFKICLGFLRKANRDGHTSRSIEIPACGVFFLAERTSEHLALFEEGSEAEFFSDDSELVKKIEFYIKNPMLRAKIAAAGAKRCLSSGYDYKSRLELMINNIEAYAYEK